jgi:uncharacterized repeat protein (TIGR02543 family)
MFSDCSGADFNMNSVFNLPQGITTAGEVFAAHVFDSCSGVNFTMNSIFNLPKDIVIVGRDFAFQMFYGCASANFTMNSVFNLPQNITTVGDNFVNGIFRMCSGASFNMNSIFNLPQKVTTVGENFADRMFSDCSGADFNMNSVFNLPQGITTVEGHFVYDMFLGCGNLSGAFQVNNVFKIPLLTDAQLMLFGALTSTFALNDNALIQNRSALSILNGNKVDVDDESRDTFNNKFQDLAVIQQHFGGNGGSDGGNNREVYYELNAPDVNVKGVVNQTIFPAGAEVTLAFNSVKLSRAGYTFVNWNTEPDGIGGSYSDGENIGTRNFNLSLYAQWAPIAPALSGLKLTESDKNVVASWSANVEFTNYQLTLKNVVTSAKCVYSTAGKEQASSCVLFSPPNGVTSYTAKGLFAGTYTATLSGVYSGQTYNATASSALKLSLTKGANIPFTDISKLGADSKAAINWMAQYGVTGGDGKGHYEPSKNVTREQMALFLYRLAGSPATVKAIPKFTDISKLSADSKTAINWLGSTGITLGNGAGKYEPANKVTREQMALFMQRFAGLDAKNGTTKVPNFTDLPSSEASKTAIKWLASWGITLGDNKGHYQPKNKVTREQMALFMKRIADTLKNY